jgi:hypothetical protein
VALAVKNVAVAQRIATGSSTCVATLPTHATGDLLIVIIGGYSSTYRTLSPPAGWNEITDGAGGLSSQGISVYWKTAASGSETNPTFTFSSATDDEYSSIAVSLTGHKKTAPIGAVGTRASNSNTTHTSNGVTATGVGSLVFYFDIAYYNVALGTPSGWTEWFDTHPTSDGGYTSYYRETGGYKSVAKNAASGNISVASGSSYWAQVQIEILADVENVNLADNVEVTTLAKGTFAHSSSLADNVEVATAARSVISAVAALGVDAESNFVSSLLTNGLAVLAADVNAGFEASNLIRVSSSLVSDIEATASSKLTAVAASVLAVDVEQTNQAASQIGVNSALAIDVDLANQAASQIGVSSALGADAEAAAGSRLTTQGASVLAADIEESASAQTVFAGLIAFPIDAEVAAAVKTDFAGLLSLAAVASVAASVTAQLKASAAMALDVDVATVSRINSAVGVALSAVTALSSLGSVTADESIVLSTAAAIAANVAHTMRPSVSIAADVEAASTLLAALAASAVLSEVAGVATTATQNMTVEMLIAVVNALSADATGVLVNTALLDAVEGFESQGNIIVDVSALLEANPNLTIEEAVTIALSVALPASLELLVDGSTVPTDNNIYAVIGVALDMSTVLLAELTAAMVIAQTGGMSLETTMSMVADNLFDVLVGMPVDSQFDAFGAMTLATDAEIDTTSQSDSMPYAQINANTDIQAASGLVLTASATIAGVGEIAVLASNAYFASAVISETGDVLSLNRLTINESVLADVAVEMVSDSRAVAVGFVDLSVHAGLLPSSIINAGDNLELSVEFDFESASGMTINDIARIAVALAISSFGLTPVVYNLHARTVPDGMLKARDSSSEMMKARSTGDETLKARDASSEMVKARATVSAILKTRQ